MIRTRPVIPPAQILKTTWFDPDPDWFDPVAYTFLLRPGLRGAFLAGPEPAHVVQRRQCVPAVVVAGAIHDLAPF
jgi:hypothetical protein